MNRAVFLNIFHPPITGVGVFDSLVDRNSPLIRNNVAFNRTMNQLSADIYPTSTAVPERSE